MHLALDFGTTNSVAAVAESGSVRVLHLSGLTREQPLAQSPLVPTALFALEKTRRRWPRFWQTEPLALIGQQALARNYDGQSPAYAASFKPLLASQPHRPVARVERREIAAREASYLFLREMLEAAEKELGVRRITDLTIPAPVGYFETYRAELLSLSKRLGIPRFKTLDEPVAAGLGYGVNAARDDNLLVFDFGGGTLNLAVARLGNDAMTSGAAPILAKHMVQIGGDDVDRWLLEHLLLDLSDLPDWQYDAKWEVMRAKEEISRTGQAIFRWRGIQKELKRDEMVRVLTEHRLYDQIRLALDEIVAQLADSPESPGVDQVLLTGGSTLLPEVAAVVDARFPQAIVRHDPAFVFTAVASGAARFAGGVPVDDFVYHDYSIAVQNDQTHAVEYELLIPRRTRYPTAPDFAVRYYADYPGMEEMRFRVCEVGRLGQVPAAWDERPNSCRYWHPENETDRARVIELNPGDAALPLRPAGQGTSPRLRVTYHINSDRYLCTTVEDLIRKETLKHNEPVVRLR